VVRHINNYLLRFQSVGVVRKLITDLADTGIPINEVTQYGQYDIKAHPYNVFLALIKSRTALDSLGEFSSFSPQCFEEIGHAMADSGFELCKPHRNRSHVKSTTSQFLAYAKNHSFIEGMLTIVNSNIVSKSNCEQQMKSVHLVQRSCSETKA
jgi:hypothetical protein